MTHERRAIAAGASRGSARTRVALPATLLATAMLASACSNSELVLRPLYNRLDDRLEASFAERASPTPAQRADYAALADNFHVWHRKEALPEYARLARSMLDATRDGAVPGDRLIAHWFDTIEGFSNEARRCNPINFTAPLLRSLSDEQLAGFARHVRDERAESASRSFATRRRDIERRAVRYASFAGFEFSARQRRMLRGTLERTTDLGEAYRRAGATWYARLFEIAAERDRDDVESRLREHLDARWTAIEDATAEGRAANRALWTRFAADLLADLDAEQRGIARRWSDKLVRTVEALSRDEPSAVAETDPTRSCAVSSA